MPINPIIKYRTHYYSSRKHLIRDNILLAPASEEAGNSGVGEIMLPSCINFISQRLWT
jgi:hypothetical protein